MQKKSLVNWELIVGRGPGLRFVRPSANSPLWAIPTFVASLMAKSQWNLPWQIKWRRGNDNGWLAQLRCCHCSACASFRHLGWELSPEALASSYGPLARLVGWASSSNKGVTLLVKAAATERKLQTRRWIWDLVEGPSEDNADSWHQFWFGRGTRNEESCWRLL